VAVSYCSHEVYGGVNTPDPHNPNTTPDGKPRTTNGLLATKAAIQYAESRYPTTDVFLHGTSAGSVGTFPVAWGMQLQGVAPAGLIADASIVNLEAEHAAFEQGLCLDDSDPARLQAIAARVHPDLANIDNDPVPDCSTHVVTNKGGLLNTDPASPADYLTAIMGWVHARLADPSP
jgi:hypothetical protein